MIPARQEHFTLTKIATPMNITESNSKIIELLAKGKTVKEIAADLDLSPRTVQERIDHMRKDHNCRNVTHLVATLTKQVILASAITISLNNNVVFAGKLP